MIERVLPFIHSLHTRCYNFQFSCTAHSVHLAADLQVVMAFQKKRRKKPKQKTQTPIISISDKQSNHEWGGKDLICKSCEQSCLCLQQLDVFMAVGEVWVQESINWMFEALDVALQTAAAPKWHFWNKFLQLFLHCWGHFTSLLLKWEDGSKCYTSNLLSVVHMGISQGHF